MSSGNTPVTPVKPAIPINWQPIISALLAIALAFLGGIHSAGTVPGTNPVPAVVPPVVPPQPQPNPQPAPTPVNPPTPDPAPKPDPTPPVVPPLVTFTDRTGNQITSGKVDAGKMFTASSDEKYTLKAFPISVKSDGAIGPDAADADVITIAPNKLAITLRSGCVCQIAVTSANVTTLVQIACNQAPQPPPPNVDPPVNPPVNPPVVPPVTPPAPGSRMLAISVVEDPMGRTNTTAAVLNDVAFWNGLQAKGHKVRLYAPSTTEVGGIKSINAMKSANKTPPSMVITDLATGQVLSADVLPSSIPAIQAVITGLGG